MPKHKRESLIYTVMMWLRDGTLDECLQRDAAYGTIRCGDFKGSMAWLPGGLYFCDGV